LKVEFVFIACLVFQIGCRDHYPNHLKGEAGSIIKQSIEAHGGWESWNEIDTLSVFKHIWSYNDSGEIALERAEKQFFIYRPTKEILIEWEEDDTTYFIDCGEELHWYLPEHGAIPADSLSILNTALSAEYVFCMPFKLADPGARFQYQGIENLEDGQQVYAIEVNYDEDKINHPWTYFFDTESLLLAACLVRHADGYSYIKNTSYISIDGRVHYHKRLSYDSDSLLQNLKLRASYLYQPI